MHVLTCQMVLGSLYSVKMPFTHQSSLVYPLPPPSTLKGMLANALQRHTGQGPLETLHDVEVAVRFVGTIPLAPIVLREHVVSTVVNLSGHGKATDALARQFAFSPSLGAVVASDNGPLLTRLVAALSRAALYLGDSESLVTCTDFRLEAVEPRRTLEAEPLRLRTYVPVNLLMGYGDHLDIYWVQTECWQPQALRPYLFPLQRQGRLFRPAPIDARLSAAVEVVETAVYGTLVLPPVAQPQQRRRR